MSLPDRDVTNRSKKEFLDDLVVLMGGRIAEEKFTGDISTGARMDIKMASETARKMICAYGMSEEFGFQSFGENEETFFLGRELTKHQTYSEETARKIDAEVDRLAKGSIDGEARRSPKIRVALSFGPGRAEIQREPVC